MRYTEIEVHNELVSMGFKGKMLRDLQAVITDADTMHDFYNFITTKGEGMTKLLLVHKFCQHMQDKHSFASCDSFVEAYSDANGSLEKSGVIAKLFATRTGVQQLNKVVEMVELGNIPLTNLYSAVVKHRSKYSSQEIVTLLEEAYV